MASFYQGLKRLATAQSLAADFTTEPTKIQNQHIIAWNVSTSGVTDNTGTFSFQVRHCDPEKNEYGPWTDLAFSGTTSLADDDDNFQLEAEVRASEARLKFTAAGAGTPDGTAEVWVNTARNGA